MHKPLFAKRHYEFIARRLADEYNYSRQFASPQRQSIALEQVSRWCEALAADNPNFKQGRFRAFIAKLTEAEA